MEYEPPCTPIDYLYRDDELLAVNKAAGLLSVPGRGESKQDCLVNRVRRDHPGALVVHRLDMATSGVILFALRPAAQKELGRQFEQREVGKKYTAVVRGRLEGEGIIELPLACDWPNRPRQQVDWEHGKPAQTRFEVVEHGPGDTSRVQLYPLTGRSHQLRVHMCEIGHPILGDELYASGADRDCAERLLLHASSISFTHPAAGEKVTLSSEADF